MVLTTSIFLNYLLVANVKVAAVIVDIDVTLNPRYSPAVRVVVDQPDGLP